MLEVVFLKEKKRADRRTTEERCMPVVKSNLLIQKSRYSLSIQEQKIVLYLISKIKPEDTGLEEYTFDIKDFCKVVGIDYNNGKNYQNVKATVKNLADRSIWVTLNDGTETLLRWIERPYINKGSGIIRVKMDELMMPYLIQLKNHFTQYNLYYVLAMRSQYSVRLYELLKSYQNLKIWTFYIAEFKRLLGTEYEHFYDLKRYILIPAVKEINEFSDLNITYELIKKGKAYDQIKFFIEQKKDSTELIQNVQLFFNEFCPWER